MAFVVGLARWVLRIWLLCQVVLASAATVPATPHPGYVMYGGGGSYIVAGPGPAGQVCSAFADYYEAGNGSGEVVDTNSCKLYEKCPAGTCYDTTKGMTDATYWTCSNGGDVVVQGTDHVCVTHEPHNCPAAGTTTPDDGSQYTWPGINNPGMGGGYCDNGCGYMPQFVSGTGSDAHSMGGGISLGSSCGSNAGAGAPNPKPSTPAPDPAPPNNCQAPTGCPGQVNGTTVCTACGTPTSQEVSGTTTTQPDGSQISDTTVTSTKTNDDGSVTTTSTTSHSNGSSTTTTSTVPAGAPGNPNNGKVPGSGGSNGGGGSGSGGGSCTGTSCGNQSSDSFGGSCSASFTCDGDAIQCSIAKEQHFRSCELFQPETQGGDWADGASTLKTARTDGDRPGWSPAHESQTTSTTFDWSTSIDHSTQFGAACPADVQVGETGMVIGFGALCEHAAVLGNFIVAMTALACMFIIFKDQK